jgi:DNA-binding MarR family transcriptional regulator
MDVTTMSRSLDRLEESGYLVREKDPGCRRSYLICLTGEGAAEAHKVRRVLEMVDDVIWKGLGQDEMEAFCGTMEKICENLEQCDFKWDDET